MFLSVRDEDKDAVVEVARGVRTARVPPARDGGNREPSLRAAGLEVADVRKVSEPGDAPTVVDLIRRGRCDLIVNTPGRRRRARGRRLLDPRGCARRARAVHHHDRGGDGCHTCDRRRAGRDNPVFAGANRCRDRRARRVGSSPSRRSVRMSCCASNEAMPIRERPGSSSCSRRRAGRCRVRCPSAWRRRASCWFLLDPVGPGTRALAALAPGDELHVFGPLGNGFRLDVRRPLLVGGGIGIAPLPYLARRSTIRRPSSGSAARSTPRLRRCCPPPTSSSIRCWSRTCSGRSRRARVRARADARSGARARARRATRVGGADGSRLRQSHSSALIHTQSIKSSASYSTTTSPLVMARKRRFRSTLKGS